MNDNNKVMRIVMALTIASLSIFLFNRCKKEEMSNELDPNTFWDKTVYYDGVFKENNIVMLWVNMPKDYNDDVYFVYKYEDSPVEYFIGRGDTVSFKVPPTNEPILIYAYGWNFNHSKRLRSFALREIIN